MITFPNTFVAGQTTSAAQMMANLNAVKTASETDKWGTGNLQAPNALFPIVMEIDAVASGGTILPRFVTPAGITLIFVSASLSHDTESAATVVATGQVYETTVAAGDRILTTALATAAADTPVTTTDFFQASVPGGTTLIFEIKETSSTGTLDDVTLVLWCKAVHQA
ncbi:MAG: hypothetical protein A3E78_08775 [Alphaproteobacteria bacterium RIFCSPHIGHO2_12_FULL_63_12]|nr:MAG: hypothetical protein A3E78_08775 [Alphaproteobacteria bacterium RIFCSPHIGHO2_12_FULL_63_12]